MNEVVEGNPINLVDQARNILVVHGRGESTHKPPTPSCQLPLAVMRLLPPLIVVSALLGGCNTTGSLPSTGSSEPGADEAADPASTLLLVADPATPLLVALGFPSEPLIVQLDHAERGVGRCGGRCMGRCGGVSLSTRPQRGSTEKEPEEPERTKDKERTRKKMPVPLGSIQCTRYLWAVSSIGCPIWAISRIGGTFWEVSSVGGTFWVVSRVSSTFLAVLRVGGTFWRHLELAVFFWRKRQNQNMAVLFRQ